MIKDANDWSKLFADVIALRAHRQVCEDDGCHHPFLKSLEVRLTAELEDFRKKFTEQFHTTASKDADK